MPFYEFSANPYLLYPLENGNNCGVRYPAGYFPGRPYRTIVGDFYSNIAQDLSNLVPVRFNGSTAVSGMVLDSTGSSVTLQKEALYHIHYELMPVSGSSPETLVNITVNGVVLPQSIRQLSVNGAQVSADFTFFGKSGDLIRLNVDSSDTVSLAAGSNVNSILNITQIL